MKLNANLTAGITYTVNLDFDAARSIVESGNGKYHMKPVIRAFADATSGAIKGVADPITSIPQVMVISGTDTIAGTIAAADGKFLLKGIAAGTYKVVLVPKTGVKKEILDVKVETGKVTDLATIKL